MENHTMGAKLFHVDKPTNKTSLIVNFHNFVNVPNNLLDLNFCLILQKIWLHMFSTKNKTENRRNKEICISESCEVYRTQLKL
jgi:hypothetical protein